MGNANWSFDSHDPLTIRLAGEITMNDAKAIDRAWHTLHPEPETRLDLSGVTHFDSALMILLIHWISSSEAQGHTLQVQQAPRSLQAIAEGTGVATWLEQRMVDKWHPNGNPHG